VPQPQEVKEQASAVKATPAATVAGATPGRRPFGSLNANTQAVGGAQSVFAAKLLVKPAPNEGADSALFEGPVEAAGGVFSNTQDEGSAMKGSATAAAAAAPCLQGLMATTQQPEQPAALAAGRTSRRFTRSKTAATGVAAGSAGAVGLSGLGVVKPGRGGQLGLFAAAAASSPAPAMAGCTPTRLMR
jgi:hypothetical protein